MDESNKHKRNQPCENCRKHRRKCISVDSSSCERCQRIKIKCIFIPTEKPPKSKPNVSITQQNELLTAVWALEQQTEQVRLQLSQMKSILSCHICKQINCDKHRPWNLMISKGERGIQIQTTVKSLSDLETFLKEGLHCFHSTDTIPQPFSSTGGARKMDVTHPNMKIDGVFRTLFYYMSQEKTNTPLILENNYNLNQQCRYFKLKMIQNYFSCIALLVPLLPIPIYMPKLCGDLDSLLANTIAYLASTVPCNHIDLSCFSYTRKELGEACRLAAKKQFQDCLFEEEPSPEMSGALLLMAVGSIYDFRGKEARAYASLCWTMIKQIRPIKPKCYQDKVQEQIRIRVFYLSRYVEYIFLQSKDDSHCYAHAAIHIDLSPEPLPCELTDKTFRDSISCFQFLTRIMSISRYGSDQEATMFSFFGGRLSTISSASIQALEQVLVQIWESMPLELRIGNGPFEYMDPEVLSHCTNRSFSLRVNAAYYVYWLNLQTKVMQSPQESHFPNACRLDADRALAISSICADAATKIYSLMEDAAPCMFEIRWLATTLDILRVLSQSSDRVIRKKAKENSAVLSRIIQNQLQFGICHEDCSQSPQPRMPCRHGCATYKSSDSTSSSFSIGDDSSCSDSSCSSKFTEDTLFSSHTNPTYITPFYTRLKSLLENYMIDNEII